MTDHATDWLQRRSRAWRTIWADSEPRLRGAGGQASAESLLSACYHAATVNVLDRLSLACEREHEAMPARVAEHLAEQITSQHSSGTSRGRASSSRPWGLRQVGRFVDVQEELSSVWRNGATSVSQAADPLAAQRLLPAAALADAAWLRVVHELDNARCNLALAYASATARSAFAGSVHASPDWNGRPSLTPWDAWMAPPLGEPPQTSQVQRMRLRIKGPEQWVVDGHPWHPMSKTRLGLTDAEVLRYAPEHLASSPVMAIDLPQELLAVTEGWTEFTRPWLGSPAPGLLRVPIHAAQLVRLGRGGLLERARARLAEPLAGAPQHAAGGGERQGRHVLARGHALASLRTVAVPAWGVHIKLAINVETTSAKRNVSPHSVTNGPLLSALLREIAARDSIAARLLVAGEDQTIGLRSDIFAGEAGQIGAIVRESATFEGAALFASLGECIPGTTVSLLQHCVEAAGGPAAFFRGVLDGLVEPGLRLASVWGIALELHQQNVLLMRPSGSRSAMVPKNDAAAQRLRFIVRDLGGIRLHSPRLAAAGREITLAPGSFTQTSDLDEMRDKLSHTLMQATLSSMVDWLEPLGLVPHEAWQQVAEAVEGCLTRWSHDTALTAAQRSALRDDRCFWSKPTMRAKALFAMRLHQRVADYEYVEVHNPLAARLTSLCTDRDA